MILSIPLMNQNNANMKLFNVLCETQEHNIFTAHDLAAWIGCMEATRLSIFNYKKMSRCTNHIDMLSRYKTVHSKILVRAPLSPICPVNSMRSMIALWQMYHVLRSARTSLPHVSLWCGPDVSNICKLISPVLKHSPDPSSPEG